MSLFNSRTFWETKPSDEEYDSNGFCISTIDKDASNGEKIITGSLSGMLRIYAIKTAEYKIDDLIVEVNLEVPILQVCCGKFIPNNNTIALAILHPFKLSVYKVLPVNIVDNVPSYYELSKCYEHKLDRSAYNMCIGPFGGIYNKDYICVQSLDCQLSFYEQDSYAFTRALPNSLIPSPLCYLSKTDSFIIQNSVFEIECYKYQVLSAASGNTNTNINTISEDGPKNAFSVDGDVLGDKTSLTINSSGGLTSGGKRLQVDWSISLGESAIDIQIARFSRSLAASQVDILVLGEHTLFTIKEGGTIRIQKRLDYNPSCFVPFNIEPEYNRNSLSADQICQQLLIGTHEEFLMLYRDTQLIWASKYHQNVPIALKVGTFAGVRGLIVGMSDNGHVIVSYMGSDPPSSIVAAAKGKDGKGIGKELDYKAMDEEHRKLLNVIRQSASSVTTEPTDKVVLKPSILLNIDYQNDDYESPQSDFGSHICAKDESGKEIVLFIKVAVSYSGTTEISELNLCLNLPEGFYCDFKTLKVAHLSPNQSQNVVFRIKPCKLIIPSSNSLQIVSTYSTSTGEPRISQASIDIPFNTFSRAVPPRKNTNTLYTIDTNQAPVAMTDLFPDLLDNSIPNYSEIQRHITNTLTVEHNAQFVSYSALPFDMPVPVVNSSILLTNETNPYMEIVDKIIKNRTPAPVMSVSSQDCSILVSKKGGRYRLQGSNLESMWIMSAQLIDRLGKYFSPQNGLKDPLVISFQEDLPLANYFSIIDEHFAIRQLLFCWKIRIESLAHQFRSVQKRLLARFKDKNPAPLKSMDVILSDTHASLIIASQHVEIYQQQLSSVSYRLSAATSAILLLVRYKYAMEDESYAVLRNFFSPVVCETSETGWEEMVDASISYCIKYAGNSRAGRDPVPPTLILPKDTTKLKKHIQSLFEKINKGFKLVSFT